jgi:predicted transcriptional regulator
MPKISTGTRLEQEIYERLERIAKVDRRTISNIIEICVAEYLPKLEAEIMPKDAFAESHPPYRTRETAKSKKN